MFRLLALVWLGILVVSAHAGSPPAPPQTIVVIACRVDDLTGQSGRQDPDLAAKDWRDLEWHLDKGNELECKREVIPLEDSVALVAPETPALHPDFSSFAQCAAVAMQYAPTYEKANKGWAVMAVGCPTKITNGPDGPIIGWKLPECPFAVNGMPIICRFDGSLI